MKPNLRGEKLSRAEYWRGRLSLAEKPIDAIGAGFYWDVINEEHKKIIDKYIKGRVLDVGCGIGRIAKWFEPKSYLGFDFVTEFIDIAKKENPKHGFVVLDLREKLPFKKHEFNWAILVSVAGVMENALEDWNKKELLRCCENILILEYTNPEEYEVICLKNKKHTTLNV